MKNIKIQYEKNKDYKILPATGMFGGVSPNGSIYFNFFVETNKFPENTILEVNEKLNIVSEKIQKEDEPIIIRELLVGLVAEPEAVRRFGEWLIRKADEANEAKFFKKESQSKTG